MPSKYVNTLIKIADYVSTEHTEFIESSCALVSIDFKNLPSNICYSINCKNCAFNALNHKKIDYLITEGNSDG